MWFHRFNDWWILRLFFRTTHMICTRPVQKRTYVEFSAGRPLTFFVIIILIYSSNLHPLLRGKKSCANVFKILYCSILLFVIICLLRVCLITLNSCRKFKINWNTFYNDLKSIDMISKIVWNWFNPKNMYLCYILSRFKCVWDIRKIANNFTVTSNLSHLV